MPATKVLLVEDEVKTAEYLSKGLKEAGFEVDVAIDGDEGLKHAVSNPYDVLILDIMLPKQDGFQVMAELGKTGKHPITLVLTARDQIGDRVRGLDSGADAYFVKPVAFAELIAQIRSLLRRDSKRGVEVLKVADLEIDFYQRKVARQGRFVELTPKEFSILSLLARRKDEIISRSVLAEQVWGLNFDSETNVVDVHMRRLRAKIDDPFTPKLIHTVRGMGYVLRENNNQ